MTTRNFLISDIPKPDRPREKCELLGPEKLTDDELLALILCTGTRNLSAIGLAREILEHTGREKGLQNLFHLSKNELLSIRGVGKAKLAQILAVAELSVRLSKIESRERISYSSPDSIARYYMAEFRSYRQEHLMMMMFDGRNHLIGEHLVSKGTATASLAEPREIFSEALRQNALYIILIHNHPSGDPVPSPEDLAVTERIYTAGDLIGIQLLDHIIVAGDKYRSLKADGCFIF